MNFRTTLLLLLLVAAVGLTLLFTGKKGEQTKPPAAGEEHKLIDIAATDVTKVALTPADGTKFVLEKAGGSWKLTQPIAAAAKGFEADDLVRALVNLQSRGEVDASQKSAGGLDRPSYVVELTSKGDKTTKLSFGDKSGVGDTLYVLLDGKNKPDIIATGIYSQLEKPATSYRETRLVSASSNDIRQLAITEKGQTIELQKTGDNWKMVRPQQLPADNSSVFDVLSAITGLNASEYVEKKGSFGLNHPRVTVWFSTEAPSTQPAATQPADAADYAGGQILRFGGYRDVTKTDVYASLNGQEIALVPASSEKSFEKTPLDLRNRELLNLDPEKVSSFSISVDRPATTQPTTRSADKRQFTIERRKEAAPILGPALPPVPATRPAGQSGAAGPSHPATPPAMPSKKPTGKAPPTANKPPVTPAKPSPAAQPSPAVPATIVAATEPAEPTSKWLFASGGNGPADEGQIKDLLDALHPLRVEKYVESPTSQPAPVAIYILTVRTIAATASENNKDHFLRFIDRGPDAKLLGIENNVAFEIDRSLLDKLTGDFKTPKPAAPSSPPLFPGNLPPGHPPLGQ